MRSLFRNRSHPQHDLLSSMMEGNMDELESRAAVPLVCVTDGQHHIRKFLREALREFRFTIYE